jgi:hypothetical protein
MGARRRASCISRATKSNSTNQLNLPDPRDRKLGHLLGTADFIAQMADRCYLEKCRDRLYPEFVLGGLAAARPEPTVRLQVRYSSGWTCCARPRVRARNPRARLEGEFEHAYRYLEVLFGGKNPYLEAIDRNLGFLHRVLRTERWPHAAPESAAVHLRGRSIGSGARLDAEPPQDTLGLSLAP